MEKVPIVFMNGPLKGQREELTDPLPIQQLFHDPRVITVGNAKAPGYWYRRVPAGKDGVSRTSSKGWADLDAPSGAWHVF